MRIFGITLLLLAGFLLCAQKIDMETAQAQKKWTKTIQGVYPEENLLRIEPTAEDLRKRGLYGVWKTVSFPKYAGQSMELSVEMKLDQISAIGNEKYSGSVFLVHWGKNYFSPRSSFGSSPWKTETFIFPVPESGNFQIMLGMQGTKGTIRFRNLRAAPADRFVDISKAANMGFADEHEKDGKGGWADQGPENDASTFKYREKTYAKVPFQVLDPEKNNGKSVLTFGSIHFPAGIRKAEIPVQVDGMKNLYLLHTACWAPKGNPKAGTILLEGTSGRQEIPVVFGKDVADQWNPFHRQNAWCASIWQSRTGGTNGVYVSRFAVDPKIGAIRKMTLTGGNAGGTWVVVGMTFSKKDYPSPVKQKFTVQAGDRFRALPQPESPKIIPGSALDFSSLNTGKIDRIIINSHGRIAQKSAPEKPFRFFAVGGNNTSDSYVAQDDGKRKLVLEAIWKDKKRITEYVEELKRHGCNMLRIHCMDIVLVKNGIATLNPGKIDLWDWCIAECKRNGIYVQIDTMDSNGFTGLSIWSREGTAVNAKFQLLFSEALRKEYKIGMKKLLEHVNPYTKMSLRDDPVLALLNYCNEQEFAFIYEKYPREAMLPEWRKFIGDPNAPLFTVREWHAKNEKGAKINAFITMKWRELLAWYRKTIHDEIGYKGLGNLWEMTSSMHYNVLRNDLDYVMMHAYHAHTTESCTAQAQGSDVYGSMKQFRTLIDARIAGRPFLVNEYASVYWNRYRYEEPFAVGAYAAFQGFDMLVRHGVPIHVRNGHRIFPWLMAHDPITRASLRQTALLYMRGDVQEGKRGVRLSFSERAVSKNRIWSDALNSVQSRLALIAKFGLEQTDPAPNLKKPADDWNDFRIPLLGGASVVENTEGFASSLESGSGNFSLMDMIEQLRKEKILAKDNRSDGGNLFETSTGEIFTDRANSSVQVNTPRFQGICGTKTKADLRDVSIQFLRTPGIASVASLQADRGIGNASRLLLVYATNALSNKMTFDDESMVKVRYYGENPTMIETGRIRVEIRNKHAETLTVYPLKVNGERCKPIQPVSRKKRELVLDIDTAQLPEGPSLYFELIASGEKS